jgi:hypothetical protein
MAAKSSAVAHWPSQAGDSRAAACSGQRLAVALEAAKEEYKSRRRRKKMFGSRFFSDPVWDLLLDLFIATAEGRRIVVSSACIAAEVPRTTALRQIKKMEEAGLLLRLEHPRDNRCTIVSLTTEAYAKMLAYFGAG